MPDWKRYHAAIVAGSAMAEIANACETAWPWLDLTPDERRARITENIHSDNSARWMLQALNFVRLRLMRDATWSWSIDPGQADEHRLVGVVFVQAEPEQD